MRMYQRRRKLSPEETAANVARKAARDAAAMTCQCCGVRYLANTGTIAHHAYQRFSGWQTGSCRGAKYAPFEASRERLGELLNFYKGQETDMIANRKAVNDETMGIVLDYPDYSKPKTRFGYPNVFFTVTRETFAELVAHHTPLVRHRGVCIWNSFDEEKAANLKTRDREIVDIRHEIDKQQKRYDGWVKTHLWNTNGVWVKV